MRLFFVSVFHFLYAIGNAQTNGLISDTAVSRIENTLASDNMQGRKVYTPGISKAADFIIAEFSSAGLQSLPGMTNFKQSFVLQNRDTAQLFNLVGIIPGKSRPEEWVVFSAHYDHLGMGRKDASGDSVYNGANDNASGVTALIMLANYFKQLHNNERTLVFVAFTAEEIGEFGSLHFSEHVDPLKIMAMINMEMIGTESKWGRNSAYLTGFDKSDLGSILQKNLKGSPFVIYPDPYPAQQLFLRSDNASLARLGVPAHTISTSKMDSEKQYHRRGDSVETLDLVNMRSVIEAIALSSTSIVSGRDTPSRISSPD